MNRVVITGMGIWSCIGTDLKTVTQNLYQGNSGIGVDPERLKFGYHSLLTGIVPEPDLSGILPKRAQKSMPQQARYAYMATKQALEQSGLDPANEEIGLLFGNDCSAQPIIGGHNLLLEANNTEVLGANSIFKVMNSTVTMNLSNLFNIKGISCTLSAACSSSSHAIGLGYLLIKNGLQDVVVCGGAQETNVHSMYAFDALAILSRENDTPVKASRPFDATRQGIVPSGGAASLVLESYEHAKARGANILAELIGWGFASNGAMQLSTPSEEGTIKAMSNALNSANLKFKDIDYINAHATGTPQGDTVEAMAINKLFTNKPYVSSTKSSTGHECWMSGASEAIYTILMIQHAFVAPSCNISQFDEHSKLLNIATKTIDTHLNYCMSNSFGFGGTNSVLIFKNYDNR